MSYDQTFYTGEGIDRIMKNLRVDQIRKLCTENIAFTTSEHKSRSKLYSKIATTSVEAQDRIHFLASQLLQEGSSESCIQVWVRKRKTHMFDEENK